MHIANYLLHLASYSLAKYLYWYNYIHNSQTLKLQLMH